MEFKNKFFKYHIVLLMMIPFFISYSVFFTGCLSFSPPHLKQQLPLLPIKADFKMVGKTRTTISPLADMKRNYFPTQRKEFYYDQYLNATSPEKNATFLPEEYSHDEDDEDFQEWLDVISGKVMERRRKNPVTTVYVSKANMVQLVNQLTQSLEGGGDDDEEEEKPRRPFMKGSGSGGGAKKKSENFEIVQNPPWNFSQVGGYDNIKEELKQCVDLLTHYSLYKQFNVRVPKGLILEGPPGNGKTLLAKAFAGECNTSFIALSGSQFQDKYVGVGASRVRELFELARQHIPCVIFMDEIDAVGRRRSSEGEASAAERDSTLNELLVGLDGFQSSEGIFLIGATNRMDMLDPALLRPGRMDKKIHIGAPDAKTREAILDIHLKGKPYNAETVSKTYLVEQTTGFSGAQIENWLNEAMLHALRKRQTRIEWEHLEEVLSRVLVGWQPSPHELTPEEIYRIAIHEMGHAIVGMMCKHHAKVVQVMIQLSSPNAPGYTQFERTSSPMFTKENLFEHLMILLAGRIAEEQFFETSSSTGAADDLEKALELVQRMILHYGMGQWGVYPRQSEKYKERIDDDTFKLLTQATTIATQWIQENRENIERGAQQLVKEHRLSVEEVGEPNFPPVIIGYNRV